MAISIDLLTISITNFHDSSLSFEDSRIESEKIPKNNIHNVKELFL